ncbi:metallophosphoesterase family protein [Desulfosporosinus youngiae]|uniref:Nuclease SbcCD subunit D n=1 Tax=Desulfosporosinus youngiae DSM 17734 TaxID=768710 RepID=H5Y246_9FIRM|nr:exonuclease SbcCD subunit D [Desulfosporosinus youngiae]EHQ88244.1 exonuclease SbcD [Desulfosporosinus youngiae DSM 17734]
MKLLHCGDIHLGSGLQYGKDDESGMNSRLRDWLETMVKIKNIAVEQDVDAVVFAGDAFKDRKPTPQLLSYFISWLKSFNPIPVVMIVGNHDLNGDGSIGPVDLIGSLGIAYTSNKPEILKVPTKSGILQVVTMPTFSKSTFLQQDEFKDTPIDELNSIMADKAGQIIRYLADQLDPKLHSILTLHGTVSGSINGSERSMMMAQEPIFALHDVALPQFDYVALAHVHRHQVIYTPPDQPPVAYSGSIERVDFGEMEPKGVIIADLELYSLEFVDLNTRPFVQINLTPDDIPDVTGAVVKVTIKTDVDTAKSISAAQITKQLYAAGASFVAGVQIEVERETRARDAEMTEHVSIPEAIGRYFEQQPDLKSRKERLMTKVGELEVVA